MWLKPGWSGHRKPLTFTTMPSKRIRGAGVVEVGAADLLRCPVVRQHLRQARLIVSRAR